MSSLVEIQGQIEKLQKQASEIRVKEFDKTVREIQAKMQAFGITIKDLQSAKGKSATRRKSAAAAGKAGTARKAGKRSGKALGSAPIKYRGPNGETWSGRGLMPRWLSQLVQQGRQREEFAVAPTA